MGSASDAARLSSAALAAVPCCARGCGAPDDGPASQLSPTDGDDASKAGEAKASSGRHSTSLGEEARGHAWSSLRKSAGPPEPGQPMTGVPSAIESTRFLPQASPREGRTKTSASSRSSRSIPRLSSHSTCEQVRGGIVHRV
jgi:hypothetical protein